MRSGWHGNEPRAELAFGDWDSAAESCKAGYGFAANGYLSVFGYAFPANGSRYAGFFGLEAVNEEMADTLQKEVPGTQVSVRYDPDNPDSSLVEDEYIRGRRLTQNPHWLP